MAYYYVYEHFDPRFISLHSLDVDIVYVGRGQISRAWSFSEQSRNIEHYKWACELLEEGWTIDQFVRIAVKTTSYDLAKKVERGSIDFLRPKFNVQCKANLLSEYWLNKIRNLIVQKVSLVDVCKLYNIQEEEQEEVFGKIIAGIKS